MPEVQLVTRVVDACMHVAWASEADIAARMPDEWQEYVGRAGTLPGGYGARPIHLSSPYHFPGGLKPVDPGDAALEVPEELDRAVLLQTPGIFLAAEPNPHLGSAVARAANDWLIERWLDDDRRLHGAVVVAGQTPAEAADEIRRAGAHPRMVGVLMGASGLDRGFGHPIYAPIHEAAAELGLPLIVHAQGSAVLDSVLRATAAGPAATFAEQTVLGAHALMTHLTSLISHGVFERHRSLQLLLVGGGMSWLPGFLWRFDADYKGMRRETPWVRRMPSEYVREHVRLTTYPLDTETQPEGLAAVLGTYEGMEDVLCYASGRPAPDTCAADAVLRVLPPVWHQKVMAENAESLFAFPA